MARLHILSATVDQMLEEAAVAAATASLLYVPRNTDDPEQPESGQVAFFRMAWGQTRSAPGYVKSGGATVAAGIAIELLIVVPTLMMETSTRAPYTALDILAGVFNDKRIADGGNTHVFNSSGPIEHQLVEMTEEHEGGVVKIHQLRASVVGVVQRIA